jgi:hypothetical protein
MPIFKKGIEIPTVEFVKPKGSVKYAWLKDWQVGDCIEVATEKEVQRIDNAVRKHGFAGARGKLSRRAVNENDQKFYRIWRVA